MSTWPVVRVDELISRGILALNDGYRVTNKELGKVGIPFVRGGDIGKAGEIDSEVVDRILPEFHDRLTTKLSQHGDVAFITKGTVGRVGMLREGQQQVVFAPQVCYWRSLDPNALDSRYIFYLLSSQGFQSNLDAVKTHGSMAADYVSLSDQKLFRIPMPPVRSQRAISKILGSLDDKIEINRKTNETLESMARATFKSWFVDFDPVRAKLDRRHPLGMSAENAELFPGAFEHSAAGLVPKGWKLGQLLDLVELRRGHDLPAADRRPGSIPIVSSGGTTGAHDVARADAPGIVTGRYGTIGKVFLVEEDYWPLNTTLYSSNLQGNDPHFIFQTLRLINFEKYSDKGAVPGINRNHLHTEPTLVPPVVIQRIYGEFAARISRTMRERLAESLTLASLRDALLPKLLSGELRTPAAEAAVSNVL